MSPYDCRWKMIDDVGHFLAAVLAVLVVVSLAFGWLS